MEVKVFDRIEKKYLITKDEKDQLLESIFKNLSKDNYHQSCIYNIYFDNHNHDLIAQSIDWTDFKHKVRARSYGGYDRVFMEIKTKIHGEEENIGFKRRFMITKKDYKKFISKKKTAEELAKKKVESPTDTQIAREIDYYFKTFNLEPRILVIYDRESYRDGSGLRITFDENLTYRSNDLDFRKTNDDKIYFKDDHNIIMEIKSHSALPLWLVKRLSALKIYPERFSKIGRVYQAILNRI